MANIRAVIKHIWPSPESCKVRILLSCLPIPSQSLRHIAIYQRRDLSPVRVLFCCCGTSYFDEAQECHRQRSVPSNEDVHSTSLGTRGFWYYGREASHMPHGAADFMIYHVISMAVFTTLTRLYGEAGNSPPCLDRETVDV